MGATQTVFGVKYYIKEFGTEFELFQSLADAESFWNNKSFDKIIPMKIVKGLISKEAISINENGELVISDNNSFKSIEIIKTNA
jgi:hypothetical protein